MQAYRYFAKSKVNGKPIKAVVYANTAQEALKRINELGYVPEGIEKLHMQDRRVHVRYNMQLPVEFNRYKPGHESKFEIKGTTINLSEGGVLINADKSYPVPTTIELMIELSESEEAIQCLSRVLRCEAVDEGKSYNIAVSFLDLSHPERNRLSEFLDKSGKSI